MRPLGDENQVWINCLITVFADVDDIQFFAVNGVKGNEVQHWMMKVPTFHARTHTHAQHIQQTEAFTHPDKNLLCRFSFHWKWNESKLYFLESVLLTICEDVTLIRVDIAQGAQGRVDVYMDVCLWAWLCV